MHKKLLMAVAWFSARFSYSLNDSKKKQQHLTANLNAPVMTEDGCCIVTYMCFNHGNFARRMH